MDAGAIYSHMVDGRRFGQEQEEAACEAKESLVVSCEVPAGRLRKRDFGGTGESGAACLTRAAW